MVSIIMGSQSDMPVMEKATAYLEEHSIPFEVNVMSAHRNPEGVAEYAKTAKERGIKVIIAGAGMAAALPGVIAAYTTLPVIGVPIKSGALQGIDALLAIVQPHRYHADAWWYLLPPHTNTTSRYAQWLVMPMRCRLASPT